MKTQVRRKTPPREVALTNVRAITGEQWAQLAKMLPNPPTPEELKDWFDNAALHIAHQEKIDNIDHKEMRKAWNRIGANMRESQKLLGAFGDLSNVAPPEMQNLKLVREFLNAKGPLLDGLHSIEKWAGTYLDFLEQLARERRGGSQPWEQWGYTLLIHVWIANGGKPSVSAHGPLAEFLMASSRLVLGGVPKRDTIPGIVKRAKQRLCDLTPRIAS
jgi:hypothetical protein